MDIIEYQNSIISEVSKMTATLPVRYSGDNGTEHAVFPLAPVPVMTERGRRAYVSAVHLKIEENVVVWVEMGSYAAAHGFYGDGTEARLSNVSAAAAVATARALIGDLI